VPHFFRRTNSSAKREGVGAAEKMLVGCKEDAMK
jgi:hypothetical protein